MNMTRNKKLNLWWTVPLVFFHHLSFANERIVVTAKEVNGTWENSYASNVKGSKPKYGLDQGWNIWALGHQKLQVEFYGTYFYPDPGGTPTANIGFTEGIATIEGNVAILKPDDSDPECRFLLTFRDKVLVVEQEGCAALFGNHVGAMGTYKRTSSKRPKFGEHQ